MANAHRGEIDAELDGRTYRLCLTLGALAELESAYGGEDLLALAERFEKAGSARAMRSASSAAGLRGGRQRHERCRGGGDDGRKAALPAICASSSGCSRRPSAP